MQSMASGSTTTANKANGKSGTRNRPAEKIRACSTNRGRCHHRCLSEASYFRKKREHAATPRAKHAADDSVDLAAVTPQVDQITSLPSV
mmetsp:Transcript_12803/g.34462  ORF Transcript_12803/g.34462 Transcript_12803/m.34462 type:complete len:89 (-) Transcript_12803:208-474(-)